MNTVINVGQEMNGVQAKNNGNLSTDVGHQAGLGSELVDDVGLQLRRQARTMANVLSLEESNIVRDVILVVDEDVISLER